MKVHVVLCVSFDDSLCHPAEDAPDKLAYPMEVYRAIAALHKLGGPVHFGNAEDGMSLSALLGRMRKRMEAV